MNKKEKWYKQYIEGIDLNNIEWKVMTSSELYSFYKKNYMDLRGCFVSEENNVPYGMYYLSFTRMNYDDLYFVGLCKNKKGKKTIICAIHYVDNYMLFKSQRMPITYIETIEVNKYFRNMGLLSKMIHNFSFVLNPNQHILCTDESENGKIHGVYNKLCSILKQNGFDKSIEFDSSLYTYSDEYERLICGNSELKRTLK